MPAWQMKTSLKEPPTETLKKQARKDRREAARRSWRVLGDLVSEALKPPPRISIAQWSDTHRQLSREASVEPGQWITEKAPYQRAVMDAISDPGIRTVVLKWASQ